MVYLLWASGPGSVVGIATGYGLDGPGIESRWETRFSAPVQTGPGAHPAFCTMDTGSLPGLKSGRGVTLTPHPLLVPWSWKGRAIPLLPLWAVRSVQSLSACTRVHFFFTFTVSQPNVRSPVKTAQWFPNLFVHGLLGLGPREVCQVRVTEPQSGGAIQRQCVGWWPFYLLKMSLGSAYIIHRHHKYLLRSIRE
jgi:hypothetical protein